MLEKDIIDFIDDQVNQEMILMLYPSFYYSI